jgi:hypothetical protein
MERFHGKKFLDAFDITSFLRTCFTNAGTVFQILLLKFFQTFFECFLLCCEWLCLIVDNACNILSRITLCVWFKFCIANFDYHNIGFDKLIWQINLNLILYLISNWVYEVCSCRLVSSTDLLVLNSNVLSKNTTSNCCTYLSLICIIIESQY